MPGPDSLSIDFAALRTLRMVHALGSFSRAAESLGVNQSTVSYTIERLRRAFSDPLFVRQGGGVVPTERCNGIVSATARMLDEFVALSQPTAFEPAEARAEVTVSCNFFERISLVPGLMRTLRSRAPGLKVNVLSSTVQGKAQLDRGETDLVIGPVRIDDSSYYKRHLLRDHYVCVMAPDNPLSARGLDRDAYLASPHVTVTYGGSWRSRFLVEIEAAGAALNTRMEVPSPAALPETLAGTDLISTVPSRVARAFGAAVAVLDCPFPAPFDVDLYWTPRSHHSPMFRWLREQLVRVAAGGD